MFVYMSNSHLSIWLWHHWEDIECHDVFLTYNNDAIVIEIFTWNHILEILLSHEYANWVNFSSLSFNQIKVMTQVESLHVISCKHWTLQTIYSLWCVVFSFLNFLLTLVRIWRTREESWHIVNFVTSQNILHACICATNQHAHINTKYQSVNIEKSNVFCVDNSFVFSWKYRIKKESRSRKWSRCQKDSIWCQEEQWDRNSFCIHSNNYDEFIYQYQSNSSILFCVNVANFEIKKYVTHDIFIDNCDVDALKD